MKVAFLDRDGALIYEPGADASPPYQIDSIEKLRILDGVIPALQNLQKQGYVLVMVTNQNGVGTPLFPQEDFYIPQQEFIKQFRENGIEFKAVFMCPHLPEDDCFCRKPKTGLVDEFLKENAIDREQSFMYGDRESDGLFAYNLGIRFIKTETNSPCTLTPSL